MRHQASTIKRIRHPTVGLLAFEHMSLDVADQPGMRLIVFTPSKDVNP